MTPELLHEDFDLSQRHAGAARRVLLLVECRGQLVEEQWVEAAAKETTLELRPAAGV